MLAIHNGRETILEEYRQGTKEAMYKDLNDQVVQDHIDLQASVSSGFSRSNEGHRMAGAMDLFGQRRQRSGTTFKPAGEQATYTTVRTPPLCLSYDVSHCARSRESRLGVVVAFGLNMPGRSELSSFCAATAMRPSELLGSISHIYGAVASLSARRCAL